MYRSAVKAHLLLQLHVHVCGCDRYHRVFASKCSLCLLRMAVVCLTDIMCSDSSNLMWDFPCNKVFLFIISPLSLPLNLAQFTDAFAKLLKASYLHRHVCTPYSLSVRMEQLGSHWTDFLEIWYLRIFRRSVQKIQFWLKSDKNSGYY